MREQVVYLMMGVSRDVARQVEDKKAHVWQRRLWSTLHGKTAVIVGIGVVGIAIGELLKALGMTVIGVTRTPRAIAGFDEMMPTDGWRRRRGAPTISSTSCQRTRRTSEFSAPTSSRR